MRRGPKQMARLPFPLKREGAPSRPLPSCVWTRHRAVKQAKSGGSVGTPSRRKGMVTREVRKGQTGGGRARAGERLMGAAGYGGKGVKERATVSGERPIGTARCRQQRDRASCQHPPPPPRPKRQATTPRTL